MKWPLAIVALVLAGLVGGAFYMRSIDPRPAGYAMQDAIKAEISKLEDKRDVMTFRALAANYTELARGFARAELQHGADPDLRTYAQRLLERVAPEGVGELAEADLGALDADLRKQLDQASRHVGTPDDRFVEIMLPLERALAELGRLADPAAPASAFHVADISTLMSASGAIVLEAWTGKSAHSH